MSRQHRLLSRQIKKHFGGEQEVPDNLEQFLDIVNTAYEQFDDDREMLERSLELSSQELVQANFELQAMLQAFPDILFHLDRQGKIIDLKGGASDNLLLPIKLFVGKRVYEVPHQPIVRRVIKDAIDRVLVSKEVESQEYELQQGDVIHFYESRLIPFADDHIIMIVRDITERKRAEESLRKRQQFLLMQNQAIAELARNKKLFTGDLQAALKEISATAARILRVPRVGVWELFDDARAIRCIHFAGDGEMVGTELREEDYPSYFRALKEERVIDATDAATDPRTGELADGYLTPHGIVSTLDSSIWLDGKLLGVMCHEHVEEPRVWSAEEQNFVGSITDYVSLAFESWKTKTSEEERKELEEQLRQSQRLEAIGSLAGGIAHDFNNIMTGIIGYSEFIQGSLSPDEQVYSDISEIRSAAQRATTLTQQLLTFSRKQIISPRVLRLNAIVNQSQRMLRRLIGADIDMMFQSAEDLWKIKVDPGQVDQILVNLVVNSRDAMQGGGKLVIALSNVTYDEEYCHGHPTLTPGEYVMLSVSDTGCGMSKKVIDRIFEPFFSTKEKNKGTGLGLSTIYGIVKQNEGFIDVSSEEGVGSIFKICFPREKGDTDSVHATVGRKMPEGTETILLVEDEEIVRKLALRILERQGYEILEACDGQEALAISDARPAKIDLLLTDVVMPKMNGKELFSRLIEERDELRVIYMSGYNEDIITHQGMLDKGTYFLQKPFTFQELTRLVREALDIQGAARP